MGAMALLNNGSGLHFQGGCDALGPEARFFLTFFDKKTYKSVKSHFYYLFDAKFGANCSPAPKTDFNPNPGIDFIYETPDRPP